MTAAGSESGFARQAAQLVDALRRGRLDEAESLYLHLGEQNPGTLDLLAIPVLIAIQRGQLHEALRMVDQQPAGHSPELRALCLRVLGDPSWHGEATALLASSSDPVIARAMRQLLAVDDTTATDETADSDDIGDLSGSAGTAIWPPGYQATTGPAPQLSKR